ncbi:MAG TPA: hypothetical protein VK478_06815 [Gemmatimonadaceae bacterium]|nr:hypothetical protein [Gemmatimonadaceae bacterium]
MAGFRGILAGLVISSSIVAHPANAQSRASTSLNHMVVVTVPSRVKVQVASLSPSTASIKVSAGELNTVGLGVTVNATQAWVLSIGSASDVATGKPAVKWSRDDRSQFSAVTANQVTVATGVSSFDPKAANVFFRNANGSADGQPVMLTVVAP